MKKKIWLIIAFCAFFAAAVLGFCLWKREQDRREAEKLAKKYQEQQEDYARQRQTTPAPAPTESPAQKKKKKKSKETKKPLEIPVDFQTLQAQNPDIYAWITIPGTVIDYPVVQDAADNTYYLYRSPDRSDNVYGSIFSENYNSTDFSDPVTVLYGHNMNDGSMFAGLHQYKDRSFMDEHLDINVYTPDAILHYRIFAAYLFDNRHLIESYNSFAAVEDVQAYIDEIMNQRNMQANIDEGAPVSADSNILTLSTCDAAAGHDYRYLVQAYLTEKIT